jgi:hypothetical protein
MKRKIKDISTSTTKQPYIPDISFHLIFCFLEPKELTLIAQCSRDFKRMVTNRSFINMYSCDEYQFKISSANTLNSLSSSPFNHLVQDIQFYIDLPLESTLKTLLTSFSRLKQLKLMGPRYNGQQISHIKQHQAPLLSLHELNIYLFHSQHAHFLDEICFFFPKLTKLVIVCCNSNSFESMNISAIINLKCLETLMMNFNGLNFFSIHETIIDTVRLLPALRVLDVQDLFVFHNSFGLSNGLVNLRRLCAQPGAPTALSKISLAFTTLKLFQVGDINGHQHIECAELLSTLPSLESIELNELYGNIDIPRSLAKWTTRIDVHHRGFIGTDICNLLDFKRINHICLKSCTLGSQRLESLITFNAPRLKTLIISNLGWENQVNAISFVTISQCTELVILSIQNSAGLVASEFHFLNQCSKLKEIQIYFCSLRREDLTLEQQKSLNLRSSTFPSLTKCDFIY